MARVTDSSGYALPAFLVSVHGAWGPLADLLHPALEYMVDPEIDPETKARVQMSVGGTTEDPSMQKFWDAPIINMSCKTLLQRTCDERKQVHISSEANRELGS